MVVHCCIVNFTSFQRDGRRCNEYFFACVKINKMDSELLTCLFKIYWAFPRLLFGIVAYAFRLFMDNLCRNSCILLAPVVQRPDNFIQWISHYPTVSICGKISIFPPLQANMHTLTTTKFGSVRKPWTKFNLKYILDPEQFLIHRKKGIRPFNNWGLDKIGVCVVKSLDQCINAFRQ